jgi:hypothetical protein
MRTLREHQRDSERFYRGTTGRMAPMPAPIYRNGPGIPF